MTSVLTTAGGVPFIRTPEENFVGLEGFPYRAQYLEIDGLRMHHIDEGPKDAPVALMVHGMPTWSYLYRNMIPVFLAAGYRCVVPDHIGFGRSDKVTEPGWYDIARHTGNLRILIERLDLRRITLVAQDWGGPTGLAQYVAMPDRFERLVIMNTWLHHEGYEYSPGTLRWIEQNQPGGLFRDNVPHRFNWGSLMAVGTQRANPQTSLFRALSGDTPEFPAAAVPVKEAYDAPFTGLGEPGVTGPRRFPLCIPANDPVAGNATEQQRAFGIVNATTLPVHFAWGVNDDVFTREWGLKWHSLIPHSTWDEYPAGHFVQDTHGHEIATQALRYAS